MASGEVEESPNIRNRPFPITLYAALYLDLAKFSIVINLVAAKEPINVNQRDQLEGYKKISMDLWSMFKIDFCVSIVT